MLAAMRLKIPLPRRWPIVLEGPPRVAEVLPGVSLTLGELEPLPGDLRAWGERIVYAELPRERVRVALVSDIETEAGWRVTFFGSDRLDDAGASEERRLHAVYVFERWGAIACLRSTKVALFDSVVKEVTAHLLKGEPEWSVGQVLHMAEVWQGLTLEAAPDAAPASAGASWPVSAFHTPGGR
jgi:hypothetical protein